MKPEIKKGIKVGLIIRLSLIATGGAWAGLTKVGIIPNWLGIEALCSCVDCKGGAFFGREIPQKRGRVCCTGTYWFVPDAIRMSGTGWG